MSELIAQEQRRQACAPRPKPLFVERGARAAISRRVCVDASTSSTPRRAAVGRPIDASLKTQFTSIELIASENFASRAIMDCPGSCLTNNAPRACPASVIMGATRSSTRSRTSARAARSSAYRLSPDGGRQRAALLRLAGELRRVYRITEPHARIMGLDLPSGGHLTHGFYTLDKKTMSRKPVSATSVYFESLPYRVHPETGLIDFDELAKTAGVFKPALIVCGGSAYPRDWDYAKFREIADASSSLLMMDMAHISGIGCCAGGRGPLQVLRHRHHHHS